MNPNRKANRRKVLKALGSTVAGSTVFAGAAAAHDTDNNRRQDTFTWAHDTVYEMLATEPIVEDPETGELLNPDSEGTHEGMEPIYIVAPQDDVHSPHENFSGFKFDHVIDLEPGTQFYSAQWHIHYVLNYPPANKFDLAKTGVSGAPLTSEDAVLTAAEEGEVLVVGAFTESGEPGAFTCPVRPHHD